jgi:hypothetical protein
MNIQDFIYWRLNHERQCSLILFQITIHNLLYYILIAMRPGPNLYPESKTEDIEWELSRTGC